MKKASKAGFTLIELLVVVVIIGILATIGMASFSKYQQWARDTKIKAELRSLVNAIMIARTLTGKPLLEITGSVCSDCVCRSKADLRNLPDNDPCVQNWYNALDRIAKAADMDLSGFRRDPWGSPYLLDENETEWGCVDYRNDRIGSAGPDGRAYGEGGGYIYMNIPYSVCRGFAEEDTSQLFHSNTAE